MKNSLLNKRFRYTYSNMVLKLIAINLLLFLTTEFFYPNLYFYLSMIPAAVMEGWVWQLFTYMFMHADFSHLFFNMFGLLIFGIPLERQLGSREFLLFYLVTGLFSGVFSFLFYLIGGQYLVVLLGASGALYGVMLLFSVCFPRSVIFIFGLIPVRAPIMVILYTVIEVANQLLATGGGVAHMTHLAGFGIAFLYCLIRLRVNPIKAWRGRQ